MEDRDVKIKKLFIVRLTIIIAAIVDAYCILQMIRLIPSDNLQRGIIALIIMFIVCCIGCIIACRFFADIMYFYTSFNLEEENKISLLFKKYITKRFKKIIEKEFR